MSNLSSRKLISLAILLSFILMQFALFSPTASAQGEMPPPATSTPTPMLDTPTPPTEDPSLPLEAQNITDPSTTPASGWTTPVNISVMSSDSSQPGMAVDDSGYIHVERG